MPYAPLEQQYNSHSQQQRHPQNDDNDNDEGISREIPNVLFLRALFLHWGCRHGHDNGLVRKLQGHYALCHVKVEMGKAQPHSGADIWELFRA
eukprot:scaffold322543_cov28-Tisochrysis_lutea.AAC.1